MPNFQLNIDIEPKDLATLCQANEKVILLKKTNAGTPVAWVTFYPFQSNTVQWDEEYALYASTQSVEDGTTITKMSDVAAQAKNLYPFNSCGNFGSPTPEANLGATSYELQNQWSKSPILTFGLAQGVQVNGTAFPYKPINASAVPSMHKALFEPKTEVVIFLQENLDSGMVVTQISSNQTELIFGGENNITELTVKYDASKGAFVRQ
jgi:hypothetical protein